MNLYDLEGTKKPKKIAESKVEIIHEFAPGQGGGSGNYFQALASAWYNGTFNSKSLQKGIKSQEDVERLLQRGIVCPDGVTRKYGIDYNATFDGVVISSDDYYEHADHDDTDSRTGKPFGPYDYMEFSDDELDEAANPAQQAAIAIAKKKEQGVAEGHADQQRKIFKKNGKPVGEVGIDPEASPGNGQWYMTCYGVVSYGGYDSYEEAVAELKHCLKSGVAEGFQPVVPVKSRSQGSVSPERQKDIDRDVKLLNKYREKGMSASSAADRLAKFKHKHMEEQGVAEGRKKPEPPEADYGADYQDMVARVKKLAGLGPLKTQYDPQKRVYRNMPTAQQPGKK